MCYDEDELQREKDEEKERLMKHPCILCENVSWKFPHPIYVCNADNHEAISIIGLEQALDHLFDRCPKKDDEKLKLDVNTLGGGY